MIRRWAHRVAATPAIRALRAVDRVVGRRSGRRSVLVEARTPMNLAVLRPVLDRLLADPRLDVWFTGVERDDLTRAFDELGVADCTMSRDHAAWTRFDLYINADPWDAVSLHRVSRQVNFFHGVAGKYDLDCPVNLPIGFDRYDRVAFPNADRLTRYLNAGIVSKECAALVGYPKIDVLANNITASSTVAASLGLDPARSTIIYAPTFSPASSLQLHGEAIIEALLESGWNVIAKLHDRSFDADPKYSGGIDWRTRLDRFPRTNQFILANSGDSTRYVLASDLLITDHSSIGFEFCVLDRPVVVFDAPDLIKAARINPEKAALLRSAATVVSRVEDLAATVSAELGHPARLASARSNAARDVFYQPGTATDRAVTLVYSMLDLAPVTALVVRDNASHSAAWGEAR
ncbi:MAG: CDP-glycerol glycerophosphotransferase family protein [Vicinamibacterales bacterium]